MLKSSFFLALTATILVTGGFRNGIEVEFTASTPVVMATCTHSEDEPVIGAECVLFTPAGENKEFQRGYTDTNGVFSFIPDVAGDWKLVVDDGHGHRKEATVNVTEAFFNEATATPGTAKLLRYGSGGFAALPLWMKAVWGLSLIFGMAGLFYLVKAGKPVRK